MSEWESIKKEDEKDMVEVKIKIPKNTKAFIINYIEQCKNGGFNLANIQYGSKEVEELIGNKECTK